MSSLDVNECRPEGKPVAKVSGQPRESTLGEERKEIAKLNGQIQRLEKENYSLAQTIAQLQVSECQPLSLTIVYSKVNIYPPSVSKHQHSYRHHTAYVVWGIGSTTSGYTSDNNARGGSDREFLIASKIWQWLPTLRQLSKRSYSPCGHVLEYCVTRWPHHINPSQTLANHSDSVSDAGCYKVFQAFLVCL